MPSRQMIRARTPHRRFRRWGMALMALSLWLWPLLLAQAQVPSLAAPQLRPATPHLQRQQRARRFLSGRSFASRTPVGSAAQALAAARAQHLAMLALPRTTTLSLPWTAVGPPAVATSTFGNVTGRVTSIAIDAADPSGNTVYLGTTGGGVWKSTNAAGPAAQVSFTPLTDVLPVYSLNAGNGAIPSLSIGAVAVGNGVVLAGTGDPNDATDSYWGEGILRSADAGATWTLAQGSLDGVAGNHSFFGLSVAGFAFSSLDPSLVVAAVSQAAEGDLVNAPDRTYSVMGLYYSTDAGITWHMSTVMDGAQIVQAPQTGGGNNGGNAATAVVWNPVRQQFVAALRYHGYYASSDGITWSRLANQPGAGLSTAACPVNANTSGSSSCPIFRGALAVQPATSDTFALTVDRNNNNQGLFEDVCAVVSGSCSTPALLFGTQIDSSPLNSGSGQTTIAQGDYDLALAAAALGSDTILYAGTIDLYRCSLAGGCSLRNTTNAQNGCLNNAAVAPAQHAIATLGGNSGPLVFVGNDGGLNRSTDGVAQTGSLCSPSDASHFDNLNTAFGASGSLAEVVSFAQDPADPNALLAGLGALGSAGTGSPGSAWTQLATGEGGYVAIDAVAPANWYLSNGAGVNIARCTLGAACQPSDFTAAIGAKQVSNDIAAIHAPFLLDPQLQSNLLVGTCRAWRGLATGIGWPGPYAISRPFGAPSATGCSSTFPVVRSLGAGGPLSPAGAVQNAGSTVLYAGLAGSLDGGQGLGGHLFVTATGDSADATTVWTDAAQGVVTNDLASSGIFNAGRFDVSSVVPDPHDATGSTVYATVMGFTGNGVNAPHLYRSADAGQHWLNISSNLPNAPANSVVVDPNDANTVYVALDTGVYVTTTVTSCASANCWSIFGTALPNAPAVELAASAELPTGDGRLGELRVGTYGRGIWQIPLLTATSPAIAAITLNPATLSFGSQQVGAAATSATITVTNSGSAPLHVSSVVTSGDYVSSNTCVGTAVAPAASCTVTVSFAPTATGQRNGLLTIYADVAGGQATAALSGIGSAPATIVLTPNTLSFPATSIGALSASQNITVANTGGSTAQLQSFTTGGDFHIVANTCTAALAANSSCTIGVDFAPTVTGPRTGTLTITDDVGVQVATLTGTATTPATDSLSPPALTFSPQALSTSSAVQQVTITNAGDVALTLIGAQIINGDFTVINGCGNSLNPRSSCALSVAFVPKSLGQQTGILQIDDQFRSQTVALSGIGIAPPGVSVSPVNGLAFGAVGLGLTGTAQILTLTNNGGLPLAISSITSTGDFSIATASNTCGVSLAPGAICTVSVTFSPAATGSRTGTVTFSYSGSPSTQISLSGVGVDFALGQSGPATLTIASGGSGSYALLLNSAAGVTGSANFTCSGIPANAICTVNPATLALGGGTALVTVTVATGLASAALEKPALPWQPPAVSWAALLLPLGWAARRRRALPVRLLAVALVLASLSGCGVARTLPGNGSQTPVTSTVTPPGSYTLNVAASSAGLVRAVSLTLVVQ